MTQWRQQNAEKIIAAVGKYPVETVKMMNNIIKYTEGALLYRGGVVSRQRQKPAYLRII